MIWQNHLHQNGFKHAWNGLATVFICTPKKILNNTRKNTLLTELKLDFTKALIEEVTQKLQKDLISSKPPTTVTNIKDPITNEPLIQNNRDFQYGVGIGFLKCAALSYFQQWYKREPTQQEHKEISALIDTNTTDLKDHIYKADLR